MTTHRNAGQTSGQGEPALLYEPANFFLVRAPAFSVRLLERFAGGSLSLEDDPPCDLTAAFARACREGYAVVRDLLARSSLFRVALSVASSDLEKGIARLRDNEHENPANNARSRRAYSHMLRYLVRMCSRPTPFGLFAGVGLGHWHTQTDLELSTPTLRPRLRPDMGWLLALIQALEQDEQLLPHFHLQRNATALVVGSRLFLPAMEHDGDGEIAQAVSLRAVPLVRSLIEHTRTPVSYAHLVRLLRQEFPAVPDADLEQVIRQLWQVHVLVSTLRPPYTHLEPAVFVRDQLRAIPAAQEIQEQLTTLLRMLAEINRQGLDESIRRLPEVVTLQQALAPAFARSSPLQVDAALCLRGVSVHRQVGLAAARAAEILLRIGTQPGGDPVLQQYRAAFVQKYGSAEVPLLLLLSAESSSGLGPPATYTHPPRAYPLPLAPQSREQPEPAQDQGARRERALSLLLAQALNERRSAVELTDTLLQDLTPWNPADPPGAPALLELYFQIQAVSQAAIDRGDWSLVVAGMTFGGRTMGRFTDLLGPEGDASLHAYVRAQEALSPEIIFADLTFQPTEARCGNVSLHPPVHRYEIAVGTMPSRPPEQVITLDDLVVGVRNHRFCVRSLRLGKEVRVFQGTMLSARFAPNVCRFLLDIAHDGLPSPEAFSWGSLRHSPFLPRVSYGNIILSPARWTIRRADIVPGGEESEELRWFQELQDWRRRWQVPRYVYLTRLDQRLLLDLEHPLMVCELATELRRVARSEPDTAGLLLQEMLPDLTHLWLRDSDGAPFVAEFVAPFCLRASNTGNHRADVRRGNQEPECAPQPQSARDPRCARTRPISARERQCFPGDDWLYLKLNAAAALHDELIAGPIRALVGALRAEKLIDDWFFIRYDIPEPHLRVRLLARAEETRARLLGEALAWGRQLAEGGVIASFSVETYQREVERYGGPRMIDAIERVFSINSDAIAAVMAATLTGEISLDPLVVAVLSIDHFCRSLGLDFPARLRCAQRATARDTETRSPDAFRAYREILCELLFPWRWTTDIPQMRERERLTELLAVQESVVSPLARQMQDLARQGTLWETPEHIIGSLLHMHLNRLGIDNAQERRVYAFWRAALESLQRRPDFTRQ